MVQPAPGSLCPATLQGCKPGDIACPNITWNCAVERREIKCMGLSCAVFPEPGKELQSILFPVMEIAIPSSSTNSLHVKGQ